MMTQRSTTRKPPQRNAPQSKTTPSTKATKTAANATPVTASNASNANDNDNGALHVMQDMRLPDLNDLLTQVAQVAPEDRVAALLLRVDTLTAILTSGCAPVPKRLLSPKEAAYMLGIGYRQCYDLIMRQELQSLLIGRSRRIPVSAVEAFIEQRLRYA